MVVGLAYERNASNLVAYEITAFTNACEKKREKELKKLKNMMK